MFSLQIFFGITIEKIITDQWIFLEIKCFKAIKKVMYRANLALSLKQKQRRPIIEKKYDCLSLYKSLQLWENGFVGCLKEDNNRT